MTCHTLISNHLVVSGIVAALCILLAVIDQFDRKK